MTFRTASAPPRPASRTAAAIHATLALTLAIALSGGPVLRPAGHRSCAAASPSPSPSRSQGRLPVPPSMPRHRHTAGAACRARLLRQPAARPGPRRAGARRSTANAVDFLAMDQVLPQGSARPARGPKRQGSLLHRQRRPRRIRTAGRGRRHHRAAGRGQEAPARHPAARHAACARHARHRRSEPADDRTLCDLFQQRLHGGL